MKNILIIIGLVCLLTSCKEKGCTDKNALNYNSLAGDDDGSCRYCTEQTFLLDSLTSGFTDYNFNSTFYGNNVLRIETKVYSTKFSDTKCKNDPGSNKAVCPIDITFTNLTNKKEKFIFTLSLGFGNQVYEYPDTVTINANSSKKISQLKNISGSTNCFDLHSNTQFNINNNGYMIYN